MEASKYYSQASPREMRRREQVNTDLERLDEALKFLTEIEETCQIHQLWCGNHLEQIRLSLEDERGRVLEG